jgi:hypothetical protein
MEIEKKTADPKKYIKEYKKKKYDENPDKIKALNKSYYYKYKFGLTSEEMKLYGDLTPDVSKVINLLDNITKINPELLKHILSRYVISEKSFNSIETQTDPEITSEMATETATETPTNI